MKTHLFLATSAIAAFSIASAAQAAPSFSGSVTAAYLASNMYSSDDDEEWHDFQGFEASGYLTASFANGIDVTADFSAVGRDLSPHSTGTTAWQDEGPEQYQVLGVHVGKNFSPSFYAGGFAGVGFQLSSVDSKAVPGFVAGVEAKKAFGNTEIFAQVGYQEWRYIIGDTTPDNGFSGFIARAGVAFDLTDRLSAMVDVEYGYSPDFFEDYGVGSQWGEEIVVQLQGSYAISDRFDIVGGYELASYTANTEDLGLESNLTFGVRMNFGGSTGFNALETPGHGFAAAGWTATTD